ncbi:hypothetical protein HNP65_001032 [Thermosipho japonicus]|uniref:Outer membrane protein beta-barrel domain-containing protein n=1 Tax=Thermosipho japonicus TaxID=90323 RepID=A0A841GN60_9BACT|nr:hypothetical protein [Thermosipho japonicus]MBB6062594.1 hypothetical protein [Thermosipho japonicus]
MKKLLFIALLISLTVSVFPFFLGVSGGKELGGKNRYILGAELGSYQNLLGISVNVFYPLSGSEIDTFENVNLSEIQLVEIDPYLLLVLNLLGTKVYAGAAPILIANVQSGEIGLYSQEVFHAKVGIKSGTGIAFSLEAITTFNTQFLSTGIYTVNFGIGLSF